MRRLALICLCALPIAAHAQQDDRDYLTAFLEDNLSSAGRQVTITGFAGALSSTATIERMTIADDLGVWITLTDITLDWSRSALLRGELTVNELTAATIAIDRAPSTDDGDLPAPEAMAFALPDLPVSVSIDRIAADAITLGPALLGQPVAGWLEASAQLAGGEGQARLVLERTDGTLGTLSLTGDYTNATGALTLDLGADEAAGGLAATLLGLPGLPSVQVSVVGSGTLADFTADLDLRTDGITRLAGEITLARIDQTQTFTANLSGNPAPLFLPDYAAFFGEDVALRLEGSRSPTGQTDISTFQIDTRALALSGSLALAPDGLPLRISLTGALADPSGEPVLLPLTSGPETRVEKAALSLQFDAARSDDWQADFTVDGLTTPDFAAVALTLTGSGKIARTDTGNLLDANFGYAATGLAPRDPALARALGTSIAGNATLNWRSETDAVSIPRLTLIAEGVDLTASAEISGISTGLLTEGRITVTTDDFTRYADLAGQPISGAGTAVVAGSFVPLGGAFDGTITLSGRNLGIGIAEVDALLQGSSRLTADLRRNADGIMIRDLTLNAQSLIARASGTIATAGSAIEAAVDFADMSALGGPYRGALKATATFQGLPEAGSLTLQGTGQGLGIGVPAVDNLLSGTSETTLRGTLRDGGLDLSELTFTAANLRANVTGRIDMTAGHLLSADLQFPDLSALGPSYRGSLQAQAGFAGTVDAGQITLEGEGRNLGLGQPEINRILAGRNTVSALLRVNGGMVQIDRARIENPQLTASATGTVEGNSRTVDVTARLANLALILPDFPGAVTIAGDIVQTAAGTSLDLRAQGPGGINGTVSGQIDPNYQRGDLAINGQAQAGLLNVVIDPGNLSGTLGFDLALNGPLQASSLSGRATLSGGRYASPDVPFALTGIDATANITGGSANLTAAAAISTGGRVQVSGTVGTAAPFAADLTATIANATLRDAQLFQTRGNGTITVQGPLTGGALIAGRIALVETELRVPSGSFIAVGSIPGLLHVNESTASRQTRLFAGLIAGANGEGGSAGGRAYPIDLEISAPNRVFVRGRGLDAELGGTLRLQGTTANVVPTGAFSLIRGRLDILGKRLALSEAELRLSGDFVPDIRILASNESDGIISSVLVEGRVSDPKVSFTSSPELPEEEVLSRLLFGRALNTLSAFQAAQLAGAVANLAGRGGEGLLAKLRRNLGLDDFDVTTAEDGTTSLTAGKYISENTYTEVEVDQQGRSTINLNLDVNDKVTVRGSLSSDGQTSIGVFLEKDY